MKRLIVILSVFFVLGCSYTKTLIHKPSNFSNEKYYKDAYECKKQNMYGYGQAAVSANQVSAHGSSSTGTSVNMELATRCMQARGYRVKYINCSQIFGCPKDIEISL